jgi:hypothetical protein
MCWLAQEYCYLGKAKDALALLKAAEYHVEVRNFVSRVQLLPSRVEPCLLQEERTMLILLGSFATAYAWEKDEVAVRLHAKG